MSIRDFKKAAVCFFDTMATFTSTELMDYRTFCKYAIISCLLAQERKDIKDQVCAYAQGHVTWWASHMSCHGTLILCNLFFLSQIVNGSDILEVLHEYPELAQHINSLYRCQYDQFFRTLSECCFHLNICSVLLLFEACSNLFCLNQLLPFLHSTTTVSVVILFSLHPNCLHVNLLPLPTVSSCQVISR